MRAARFNAMLTVKAFLNEDETKVDLRFPEISESGIILDADGLEEVIGILIDIRHRMHPLPGEEPPEVN